MKAKHEALTNKVAVITGGSGVLCSAMAVELAEQGMKIAILNRTVEKGLEVVERINLLGGEAIAVAANVIDKQSLLHAREVIMQKFGRVDLLVNGAGGNHPDAITDTETYSEQPSGKGFFDLDPSGFSMVFDVNFTGTFLASQVFGEVLLQQEDAAIINMSSMSSYTPLTKIPAYSGAKAAVNNFTEWMAVHFAATNLRVNAIAPGFFITKQNEKLLVTEDGKLTARSEKIIAATPMSKFGKPDDLLGALLFLADPTYSSFITGVTIPVDGGFKSYSGV